MKSSNYRLSHTMTKQAFVGRILPMKDKLYRLARRILNADDAEDMVQDVFVKLWTKRESIAQYQNIEAFAMVVCRNLCLDKVKSKGYQNSELMPGHEPIDHRSPERMAEASDEMARVRQTIATLPELQRTIIQLRDVEEMEYDEMAEILNMQVNAIRVNLSRARKTVREAMIKMHNYEYHSN